MSSTHLICASCATCAYDMPGLEASFSRIAPKIALSEESIDVVNLDTAQCFNTSCTPLRCERESPAPHTFVNWSGPRFD